MQQSLPLDQKYMLTLKEAAAYFGIGHKKHFMNMLFHTYETKELVAKRMFVNTSGDERRSVV